MVIESQEEVMHKQWHQNTHPTFTYRKGHIFLEVVLDVKSLCASQSSHQKLYSPLETSYYYDFSGASVNQICNLFG